MKYINLSAVASHNAIYNFILTNRGYGKSWAIQMRTWARAFHRGRKAIIIRRFKKEVKEAAPQLYTSKKLLRLLPGLVPYDEATGKGNFKRKGHKFYIKRRGRWDWFLQVAALSDANALRSADDEKCDTIYFDEFTTTPEKYALFRGDEVDLFNDIFFTEKREHIIHCYFFGNREFAVNPFFTYWHIPAEPSTYEGVKHYQGRTIYVQYVNNKQKDTTQYDKQVERLFKGTRYGAYIYGSEYKAQNHFKQAKAPKDALTYASIIWDGYELTIKVKDSYFFVCNKIDASTLIYSNNITGKYPREFKLIRKNKTWFTALVQAVAENRIMYDKPETYAGIQGLYKWLNI